MNSLSILLGKTQLHKRHSFELNSSEHVVDNSFSTKANATTLEPELFPGLTFQQSILVLACSCLVAAIFIVVFAIKMRILIQRCRTGKSKNSISALRSSSSVVRRSPTKGSQIFSQPLFRSNHVGTTEMIAHLDEFDSLTPLVITPGSLVDEDYPFFRSHLKNGRVQTIYYKVPDNSLQLEPVATDENRPLIEVTGPSPIRNAEAASRDREPIGPLPQVHTYIGQSGTELAQNGYANQCLFRPALEDLDVVSIDRTSANSTLERRGNKVYIDHYPLVGGPFYRTTNHSCGSDLQYHCSLSDYLPSDDNGSLPKTNYRLKKSKAPKPQVTKIKATSTSAKAPTEMPDTSLQSTSNTTENTSQNIGYSNSLPVTKPTSLSMKLPLLTATNIPVPTSEPGGARTSISASKSASGSFNPSMDSSNAVAETKSISTLRTTTRSSPSNSISSDLSSPVSSDGADSGSPLDTSGSGELSDSNYNASESDTSEARSIWALTKAQAGPSGPQRVSNPNTIVFSGVSGNGSSTSEVESSNTEPDLITASTTFNVFPKRFHLHSIKEEEEETSTAQNNNAGFTRRYQSKTDDTLSGRATVAEDFQRNLFVIRRSFRAQKCPVVSSSKKSTQIHLPPPPPSQSSSLQMLSTLLQQGGKLNTGGLPSWFPKRDGYGQK